MIELVVNQTRRRFDGDPATPLLWHPRDEGKAAPAAAAKQDRS